MLTPVSSFPFLNEKDLLTRWADCIPDADKPSYMLLMALCAVSSHTAALEAVFDKTLLEDLTVPDSNQYFMEAISRIPARFPLPQDLDYLRALGLLTVYSLQSGNNITSIATSGCIMLSSPSMVSTTRAAGRVTFPCPKLTIVEDYSGASIGSRFIRRVCSDTWYACQKHKCQYTTLGSLLPWTQRHKLGL
jgi:hypothetical protein